MNSKMLLPFVIAFLLLTSCYRAKLENSADPSSDGSAKLQGVLTALGIELPVFGKGSGSGSGGSTAGSACVLDQGNIDNCNIQ